MSTGQISHRPDIAGTMPADMLRDVEETLARTARTMGMFEAYAALAQQDERFEPLLESDRITVAVLEELHERSATVVRGADAVADRGHTDGFATMMRLSLNDVVPDLTELRTEAGRAIAAGWNVEEDMPAFGSAATVTIDSPFVLRDPEVRAETGDEPDI